MSNFTEWYTGTDTNFAVPFPSGAGVQPQHFYIGRLGGELKADAMGFDIQAAKQATRTFGYWDLGGPAHPARPANQSPTAWGHAQATAFLAAWRAQHQVDGATLFLDVEAGNGGWGGPGLGPADQAENLAVLQGALTTLSAAVEPGVYIGAGFWDQAFGASADPGIPFVLFLAGTPCPATVEGAIAAWDHLPTVGGMAPMIWQWRIPGCAGATQDWDLTPYGGWLHEGRWKPTPAGPTPHPAATTPRTSQEQAIALLNTAAADIQQAANLLGGG